MGRTDFTRHGCPVARAMAVLGERWAILVLREAFYGTTRFDDFAQRVGMAPATTSANLKALAEAGLLTRRPYREPGGRARSSGFAREPCRLAACGLRRAGSDRG